MALSRNSNSYTFLFAIVMVVLVGAALAYASVSLKPMQDRNAVQKKMMSILAAVGIDAERETAAEVFDEIFYKRISVNIQGDVIAEAEGAIDPRDMSDPFNVDVRKEFRSTDMAPEDKSYPIFFAEIEGEEVVVVPMAGKGLWGPIWGYVALAGDRSTVYGASFDHAGETPGLGAEIRESSFGDRFQDKAIYDDSGNLVSITVEKTGASPDDEHAVDGITGGTITGNGVQEMLYRTFDVYDAYFKKNDSEISEAP